MKSVHTVQFFDGPESVGRDVAAYFLEGLAQGDRLVLMARPAHVEAIAETIASDGVTLAGLVTSGQLVMLDPTGALRRLMCNGRPNADIFQRVVADAIRAEAASLSTRLRAYGELVDMLACDENLRGCEELEQLWRGLLEEVPIRLHSGFTSATFVGERMAAAMKRICDCHDAVHRNESDLLANWLLAQHT